jgi:dTMP kinase
MSTTRGRLVTFEGIEGCGKSTQIGLLAEALRRRGLTVRVTREPGATALGLELRKLLLDPAHDPDALTELLLYLADRRDHVRRVIAPALDRGEVVLVDRYVDSTWAYQGYAGSDPELDTGLIEKLNRKVVGRCWPELTFVLDCPAEVGLRRARRRNLETGEAGVADRFEQRRLAFHEQVRKAFLELARLEPGRFRVVDAARPAAEIFTDIEKEFLALNAVS